MLIQTDLNGTPYLGVFCCANRDIIFLPPGVPGETSEMMCEALGVDAVHLTISGSTLLGALMAVNSRGAVLTPYAEAEEVEKVEEYLEVLLLKDKHNAAGNNILVNDSFALLNPDILPATAEAIQAVLGVRAERGTISVYRTVGSAGVVTNKGLLCHPKAEREELDDLEDQFQVPAQMGTANYGTGNVGACVVANDKGAVVGSTTTPIELGRIEDALSLL